MAKARRDPSPREQDGSRDHIAPDMYCPKCGVWYPASDTSHRGH